MMKGFALVEVVITLFILSVGLLAIMGMQITALRHSQEAYLRSLAIIQLSGIVERLRFNKQSSYRAAELARWNEINAKLLPQGRGNYYCNEGACRIDLEWLFIKPEHISLSVTV
jgi:prepilin-type N-terminal cleavage/methylation domain-containing protein